MTTVQNFTAETSTDSEKTVKTRGVLARTDARKAPGRRCALCNRELKVWRDFPGLGPVGLDCARQVGNLQLYLMRHQLGGLMSSAGVVVTGRQLMDGTLTCRAELLMVRARAELAGVPLVCTQSRTDGGDLMFTYHPKVGALLHKLALRAGRAA